MRGIEHDGGVVESRLRKRRDRVVRPLGWRQSRLAQAVRQPCRNVRPCRSALVRLWRGACSRIGLPSGCTRREGSRKESSKNCCVSRKCQRGQSSVRLIVPGVVQKSGTPDAGKDRLYAIMRVFGIDCGTEFTGYGVVEVDASARNPRLRPLCAGAIKLNRKDHAPVRLATVYAELTALLEMWQPEVVAIEEVFFSANAKSALKLGQVRGVAMLAAANCGLQVAEYAPLSIKSAVVGYGLAAKEQVQFMVARLLDLEHAPEPADAADALAIAICHIHHAQTAEGINR